MALPNSPFRCYFTLVDPYSIQDAILSQPGSGFQRQTARQEVDKSLVRNLKAAAMLHDEVVFRATAPLRRNEISGRHAMNLISGAKVLLQQGALVPEVRAGDDLLTKQLERPEQFGLSPEEAKACMRVAEAMDAAPNKYEANAPGLSQARSAQLADHLFRQWHFNDQLPEPYLKPGVSHEDLEALFSILFRAGPVDRGEFVKRCEALYLNKIQAMLLIQTIYFALGAMAAEASPIFPDHMAPSQTLWNYPDLDLNSLSSEARKLADKYGTAERLSLPKISEAVSPKNVLDVMGIPSPVLDLLDWRDVLHIRQRGETKTMRAKVWGLCRPGATASDGKAASDAVSDWTRKLITEVLKEERRPGIFANFQLGLGLLGLIAGIPGAAEGVMSFVGIGTDVVGAGADVGMRIPFAARRVTPLLAYTKLVKGTALRSYKSSV